MDPYSVQKDLLSKIDSPMIFDIGAYAGDVSLLYRRLFPNSTICAFEPYKKSFDMLVNNTNGHDIKCFNLAIGNMNGKVSFNVNAAAQTNSIFDTHKDGDNTWDNKGYVKMIEKQIVDICTLDTLIKDMGITKIDILKMDTQGTEFTIIEGAINSILTNKIKLVYSEVITMPTYVGQKHLDEVIRLFRENKFSLYDIYNQEYTSDKKLRQVDAIFIHDSLTL